MRDEVRGTKPRSILRKSSPMNVTLEGSLLRFGATLARKSLVFYEGDASPRDGVARTGAKPTDGQLL
jgi:hypothetical protein